MRLVLDTGVLVEYIVRRAPLREKVRYILEEAPRAGAKLYISAVTLSEVLYVASRIYSAAGLERPNAEALNYVTWLRARAEVVEASWEVAERAGEIKKRLRIALPDCYVIATALAVRGTPIFRSLEEEMRPVERDLRSLGVRFLSELEMPLR